MDHAGRIADLQEALADEEVDAYVATGTGDTYYLTGFRTHGEGDYPMVVVPRDGEPVLLVSPLDEAAAGQTATPFRVVDDGFADTVAEVADGDLLVSRRVSARFFQELQEKTAVTLEESLLPDLRAVKDEAEVDRISAAYQVTEQALQAVLEDGVRDHTEQSLAGRVEYAIRQQGADGAAFDTIAATAAGAAEPHHVQNAQDIGDGALLFDLGARKEMYCADLSRTVHVGEPSKEFRAAYEAVKEAHAAAADAVQAGVNVATPDEEARAVLAEHGFDPYPHGVGHGLGLQVHEAPRLSVNADDEALQEGNVVTIEPGIYIDGEFGIRIEDGYVVTEDGADRLTTMDRELRVL